MSVPNRAESHIGRGCSLGQMNSAGVGLPNQQVWPLLIA